MSKSTVEKIAVMQAYLEGKTIQLLMPSGWKDWSLGELEWDWGRTDYQVKPTTKKCVGYRRYIYKTYDLSLISTYSENSHLTIGELVTSKFFVKWIDTEWQYEEYEE